MNRNELDGEWFIEFVQKQFETYKVHKQSQHIFMRDNEKIKSILKKSKTHDAPTVKGVMYNSFPLSDTS